jgi:phenylalanyl-tRNA synthetase beta chain
VKGEGACPVAIELDWPEACPVFAGRVIRGVKNGPSPDWLQARLSPSAFARSTSWSM